MPTVLCHQCATPWVDTKHQACPSCGALALSEAEREAQAAQPADLTQEPANAAQVNRILELLGRRRTQRVVLGTRAAGLANALETVAALAVVLGVVLAIAQAFVVSGAGAGAVILAIGDTLLRTAVAWGVLTTGSLVAGYVANRSE